ncbi:MAG: glycosyltransferase family 39 protein [Patescibacteria group bacterium]
MKKLILILIILLAFFLRFYRLADYPALNADEAAIGYNAYSLLETGKDEHGNPWPIHFQSFNDYKPGLYFYIILPFVKFMGLNELAVRIPGALLGVATVFVLYLLVKELFEDEKLALVSSLFLAISPWHIHFSRGGWEVNTATFFMVLGFWLFLKALKKPKLLMLSAFSFVLSLYTYHAARIVTPLLVLGLAIIYRKKLLKNTRDVILAVILGIVLILPLVRDITQGAIVSRAAGVGLFADPGPLSRINELRGEHDDFSSLPAKLMHNKAVNYGLAFVDNWARHYWGEFLFLSGDEIQRNRVPETGQMYMFDVLFVVAGLVFIAKKGKNWKPILLWFVVAPLAAALTFQSPHALRAQNMVIPLVIISAYGLISLSYWLHGIVKSKAFLNFIFLLFLLLISWGFARYLHMYWVHMAKEYPFSSQYGVKELVAFVEEEGRKYEKVIVTDRYDQPYILFLFYLKYPPEEFQGNHVLTGRDKYGFSTVDHFDKYYFGPINYDEVAPNNPRSLIVGTDGEIPDHANIIKTIYFPNGEPAFEVVAN